MFVDPIVQEVRAAREKIAIECDYDYHKIFLHGQNIWEHYKDRFKTVSKDELDRLRREHLQVHRGGG
jgi:hypothetical protein